MHVFSLGPKKNDQNKQDLSLDGFFSHTILFSIFFDGRGGKSDQLGSKQCVGPTKFRRPNENGGVNSSPTHGSQLVEASLRGQTFNLLGITYLVGQMSS